MRSKRPRFELRMELRGYKKRMIRDFNDLPDAAVRYLERIETLIGAPISLVGVGPDRSQTLLRGDLTDLVDVPEPTNA